MPIVTRTLEPLGSRWRVSGIDSRGQAWTYGPFSGTQQEAETIRDTCWSASELEDVDEQVAMTEVVENDISPETVTLHDMTRAEFRRRIARRFWRGTLDNDRTFLVKVAPYIAGFTATQIATSLGVTEARAQKIIDKANTVISITSDIAAVDAEKGDV